MPSKTLTSLIFTLALMAIAMFTPANAAPSAASSETTGVTVSSTYRLSPYDVIDVTVYGEDDLHTRTRLGSDGTAIFPLIGTVTLEGKTVAQANEIIQKKYVEGGFVKDPHTLLTVVEYRKNTFSILGQVSRPGIYEIPEGTRVSIVDAILLAGGFSHSASQNSVRVKRTVKGKSTIIKVKAGSMSDSADVPPFFIQPGDVIKVPESIF